MGIYKTHAENARNGSTFKEKLILAAITGLTSQEPKEHNFEDFDDINDYAEYVAGLAKIIANKTIELLEEEHLNQLK